MKTCPLCRSSVLFVGLNDLECSGRGCANYKAQPGDERLTSHYLLEFFGKVYKITGREWYPKVIPPTPLGESLGHSLLEIHGPQVDPICVDVGKNAISVKAFGEWIREYHPDWASCL